MSSKKSSTGIHIKPSHEGDFTAKANAAGMGVQAYASKVLNAPEGQYDPSTRRQANFAHNAAGWNHAMGGNMYAKGGSFTNSGFMSLPKEVQNKIRSRAFANGGPMAQLTEFNEGGVHEENPLGGIPQGTAPDGKLNLVEQGETKLNSANYIFSDSLKIDKGTAEEFALPKNEVGKTFAEISKKLNRPNSRRENDTIEQVAIKRDLDNLMNAQEAFKAKEVQKKIEEIQSLDPNALAQVAQSYQPQGMPPQGAPQEMEQEMAQGQPSPEEMAMMEQQGQMMDPAMQGQPPMDPAMMEQMMAQQGAPEMPMQYGGPMSYKCGGSMYDFGGVMRNVGAGAYGIGEGLLDTLTMGATDTFTDKGYDALSKMGSASDKELEQGKSIRGFGNTAGAVGGAILTGGATTGAAISEGSEGLAAGLTNLEGTNQKFDNIANTIGQVGSIAGGFVGGNPAEAAGAMAGSKGANALMNIANNPALKQATNIAGMLPQKYGGYQYADGGFVAFGDDKKKKGATVEEVPYDYSKADLVERPATVDYQKTDIYKNATVTGKNYLDWKHNNTLSFDPDAKTWHNVVPTEATSGTRYLEGKEAFDQYLASRPKNQFSYGFDVTDFIDPETGERVKVPAQAMKPRIGITTMPEAGISFANGGELGDPPMNLTPAEQLKLNQNYNSTSGTPLKPGENASISPADYAAMQAGQDFASYYNPVPVSSYVPAMPAKNSTPEQVAYMVNEDPMGKSRWVDQDVYNTFKGNKTKMQLDSQGFPLMGASGARYKEYVDTRAPQTPVTFRDGGPMNYPTYKDNAGPMGQPLTNLYNSGGMFNNFGLGGDLDFSSEDDYIDYMSQDNTITTRSFEEGGRFSPQYRDRFGNFTGGTNNYVPQTDAELMNNPWNKQSVEENLQFNLPTTDFETMSAAEQAKYLSDLQAADETLKDKNLDLTMNQTWGQAAGMALPAAYNLGQGLFGKVGTLRPEDYYQKADFKGQTYNDSPERQMIQDTYSQFSDATRNAAPGGGAYLTALQNLSRSRNESLSTLARNKQEREMASAQDAQTRNKAVEASNLGIKANVDDYNIKAREAKRKALETGLGQIADIAKGATEMDVQEAYMKTIAPDLAKSFKYNTKFDQLSAKAKQALANKNNNKTV